MDVLSIHGARENNLKNVDLKIKKGQLVVFTGLSGSGKTSMAMDTIYSEGQRRYVESLSSYARQFLGNLKKPDVDKIEGLSPAIAIDQKTVSHNPRSTVGTITEIYDYLRLLYAKIGIAHCPVCGDELKPQTIDQIVSRLLSPETVSDTTDTKPAKLMIFAVPVNDKKGEFETLFKTLRKQGWTKVRVDGKFYDLYKSIPQLEKTFNHTIEVATGSFLLTKFSITKDLKETSHQLFEAIDNALKIERSFVRVGYIRDKGNYLPDHPEYIETIDFSTTRTCQKCSISLPDFEPRNFSFNTPHGACTVCSGLGVIKKIDEKKLLDPNLSITEGGIVPYAALMQKDGWTYRKVVEVAKKYDIPLAHAISRIPRDKLEKILYGTDDEKIRISSKGLPGGTNRIETTTFEGIIPNLERRYVETTSDYMRNEIEKYMTSSTCTACNGARLKPEILAVTIGNQNIAQMTNLSIQKFYDSFSKLAPKLDKTAQAISEGVIKEILTRTKFLIDVGLEYLTISRSAETLSGGESQRIRLASQIGTGLTGVLYVLDEPSIGLHARDQKRLIETLKGLRDLGNTVIVVEHDRDTMMSSDEIVDFGPGAGKNGGEVIAQDTPQKIMKNPKSVSGPYLAGTQNIKANVLKELEKLNPDNKFEHDSNAFLILKGATTNNLKNVDVEFPIGKMICVTGVSGSGKSSLVVETLIPALKQRIGYINRSSSGNYKEITGFERIDRVIFVDQSPIGKTPRSNPATYTKVFDHIRDVFALTKGARLRGYTKSRFSFNVRGGRCEACGGEGQIKIEMQFMPDIYVDCDVCNGKRYVSEVLKVTYHDKNIAEVLDMPVSTALEFFSNHPPIREKLSLMEDVGLGYIKLGQPAPLLSGGEAQRVKLAAELNRRSYGRSLYILDEPTTGLHFRDIEKLLVVLKTLVHRGDTVIVIEHNLDFIQLADWIIDIGPEGGDRGGEIVYTGSLGGLKKCKGSWTGRML